MIFLRQNIKNTSQSGFAALLATMIVMSIIFIVVTSLSFTTIIEQKIATNAAYSAQAYYAAESGIEDSLYRLIKDKAYSADNDLPVGEGSAEISISDENGGAQKVILAKGQRSERYRNLQAEVETGGQGASFYFGAQVGDGGLVMDNNSRIQGSVYSNGSIRSSGGATITEDAWVANDSLDANQQSTINNADFAFGQANPVIDAAQSFIPSASTNLIKVSLLLKKSGAPTNKTVRILTDNAGQPSNTMVNSGAYGTLYADQVSDSAYTWVSVNLNNPAALQAGAKYWLLVDSSLSEDNYYISAKDSGDSYAGGTAKYSQNWSAALPVWNNAAGDLAFKVWLGVASNYLDGFAVGGDAHSNTILNSAIAGNAYYQTLANSSVSGTKYPNSSDPSARSFPLSQSIIDGWKTQAADGGVIEGDYLVDAGDIQTLGPKKIIGDLIISNQGDLTLSGTIYVTGNINIFNSAKVRLSPDYDDASGVIMTDGLITVANGCEFFGADSDAYILMLSTKSGPAVNVANNSDTAIFYAPNGLIDISNNTILKELVGYQVHLNNGAQIIYETGLTSVKFSNGTGGSWTLGSWEETP